MLNQIRADGYRQLHTLGIYIVLLVTVIFSALITSGQSVGGIMINADDIRMNELSKSDWSILTGLKSATLSSTVLLYLYIAIFIIVIGHEFSQKTYKNTLVSGISRLQFILSKYVMILLDVFVMTFCYYLTALITGKVMNRLWGGEIGEISRNLGEMTLVIGFFISVIFSVGVILLILSNSIVVSAVFIVLWPILIALVAMMTTWKWIKYFDFMGVAQRIALGSLKIDQVGPYIVTSLVVLIVAIVGSALIVRRKEL